MMLDIKNVKKDKILYLLDRFTEVSLYIMVFCIPFSKSVIEVTITIAFLCWLGRKFLTRNFKLPYTPINKFLFAFFIVCAASFVNADLKGLFLRSIITKCIKYIILYFIVIDTINTPTKLKNILKMAFISATVVMIDSFIQYYITHHDLVRLYPSFKYAPTTDNRPYYKGFPTGPFPFPNDLAGWMLMILFPATALFLWGGMRKKTRYIIGSFLAPFFFLFFLANVRGAWAGFLISLLLILLVQKKGFAIIAILLIGLLIMPFLPRDKLEDIISLASAKDRVYMWRIGWKIFLEHPIIGNGLNMFFHKFMLYREDEFKNKKGSYAHNGFLQMAAEIGIVGLFIFLGLIVKVIFSSLSYIRLVKDRYYSALASGLLAGVIAFLIHSFFDTNLQSLPLVVLFWFGISILMGLGNIRPSSRDSGKL